MTLNASDVMSHPVITVKAATPVCDLMGIFQTHEITGVPVVDENGALAGVISIIDVLSINEGDEEVDDRIPDFYTSPAMDGLAKINSLIVPDEDILDTPVGTLMCHNIVAASQDTSIGELAGMLVNQRIHRLLIVGDGVVKGIVSVGDVLRAISEAP